MVGNAHLNYNQKDPKTQTQFTPSSTTKSQWAPRSYIGGDKPLTPEEVQKIFEGKATCSYDNIPALGRRAVTVVRSYEIPYLVSWVLELDGPLNDYVSFPIRYKKDSSNNDTIYKQYNRYLPKHRRPSFMRDELTLRPLASQENFVVLISALLLVFYLLFKLIF